VIGERGGVEGCIRAADVVVLGQVHGDVVATGHLEIGPEGAIFGDVEAKSVRVHPGGTFRGASRIGDAGAEPRRLPTSTSPFELLPVATTTSVRPSVKPKTGGRTLPPPLGAVPPPPTPAKAANE